MSIGDLILAIRLWLSFLQWPPLQYSDQLCIDLRPQLLDRFFRQIDVVFSECVGGTSNEKSPRRAFGPAIEELEDQFVTIRDLKKQ